jgi:hypothetical protein
MRNDRLALRGVLVLACLWPDPGRAAGPPEGPSTLAEAEEAGDLTSARELSEAAAEASPGPETALARARVAEEAGDIAEARRAWRAYLRALPEAATAQREAARKKLRELDENARGRVPDEPESSHRADLDRARAEREAPKAAPQKPAPAPVREDRVVEKWYFWVTLAAIAGAAGAVVGLAVKAAASEQTDALDRAAVRLPPGPALVRW